jgi:UDPglucose--hexose-1-phosphate uridylyltransferase
VSELRKDPIAGTWVIIAPERAARPLDFKRPAPQPAARESCPFCPGRESMTPPEIAGVRSEEGWRIRVVPNRYPALRVEEEWRVGGDALFTSIPGVGAHEVVIEGPEHVLSLTELPPDRMVEVVAMYRTRLRDLKRDMRLVHGLVFRNVGERAGASLEHVHSQIIALPVVPERVHAEFERCAGYLRATHRCRPCDLIAQELKEGVRVVEESPRFAVVEPWAAKAPFETHIMPKEHASHFEAIDDGAVAEVAGLFRSALGRVERALDRPAYNALIHTAPLNGPSPEGWHWRIEIIPRIAGVAGFEWATGFFINTVPPETAAAYLRDLKVER